MYVVEHFGVISLRFRKYENEASQGLLLDIYLVEKMFSTVLEMKNANKLQKSFFSKYCKI